MMKRVMTNLMMIVKVKCNLARTHGVSILMFPFM